MHEPPRLLAMSVSDDGSNAFGEPNHDDTRTADLCAMLGRWKVAVAFAVSLWSGCDFAIGASTLVASRRRLADHPVRYGTYNPASDQGIGESVLDDTRRGSAPVTGRQQPFLLGHCQGRRGEESEGLQSGRLRAHHQPDTRQECAK